MSSLKAQLEQLENAQLVRRLPDEELAYQFKHALTQEAAYNSLLMKNRRGIHRQVAEAYERLYPDRLEELASVLVEHYAAAGDDIKTVEYAIQAGNRAKRISAETEARSHYATALRKLAQLPDNAENRRRRMDTLISQTWLSVFADAPTTNLARLDEAEGLAKELSGSDPAVQRQLGDIYHLQGFMYQQQNGLRRALRYYNEERALAHVLGDDQLLAQGTFATALLEYLQGRFAESEPLVRESIDLMRKAGVPLEQFSPFSVLGGLLAAQGDYAQGLAEAQRGLELGQQTNRPSAIEIGYSVLAEIYWMGRDLPRMLEASRGVLATAEATHDIVWVNCGYLYVAWAQSLLGQQAQALESLTRARTVAEMLQGQLPRQEWLAAVESVVLLNTNHVAEALELAERVVSVAQSRDSFFAEGVAQRVWAQALLTQNLTTWSAAEVHLAESVRLFEIGNARLEAAHTHVEWAQSLQVRGLKDSAREHFEKVAAQFQASGLTGELERMNRMIDMEG